MKISRNSANLSLSLSLSLRGRTRKTTENTVPRKHVSFPFYLWSSSVYDPCTHTPAYLYTSRIHIHTYIYTQYTKNLGHIYTYLYVQYKYIRIYVILEFLFSFTYLLACLFKSLYIFIYLFIYYQIIYFLKK